MATGSSEFSTVVVKQCPCYRQRGNVDVSSVKSITLSKLELVDQVHRLAVNMGSYGVSVVYFKVGSHYGRIIGVETMR